MELGGDDRNEGQEGETRQTQGTKEEHRKDNRKSKLLSKVRRRRRRQKQQPGVWCPLDTKCLDADVSTGDVSHGFVSLS